MTAKLVLLRDHDAIACMIASRLRLGGQIDSWRACDALSSAQAAIRVTNPMRPDVMLAASHDSIRPRPTADERVPLAPFSSP